MKIALPIRKVVRRESRKYYELSSIDHLNYILSNSSQLKNLKHVTQIHSQIITTNNASLPNVNNLLLLYAKCGSLHHTLLVFSTTPHNVLTWTTLITQLNRFNQPFRAITYFNRMRTTHTYPNQFTFSAILPACAQTTLLPYGQQIHALIHTHGFQTDTFVATALLDMYAKCSSMSLAEKVFDQMPHRNLVSWNSMIVGFLKNKLFGRAIRVFREVLRQTWFAPDQVSFSSVLSACAGLVDSGFGKQVHGSIVKRGLVGVVYVNNSLVDMYCKCRMFDDAAKLFYAAGYRDVVTWNVMIAGCVGDDNFEQACSFFQAMKREGMVPDEASYSSVLNAIACIAALTQGTLIHGHVLKTGHMKNACVSCSLVTMYGKCGNLFDAYRVFQETKDRNVVCWTAMIAVFHQHGCADEAIELFEEMLKEGIVPEYITFVSVLSACSHTGQVDDGFKYFNSMANIHNVEPGPEHYACMVDLLGRVGRLDEAWSFIESMPIEPDSSVWGALLGACGKYGSVEMGREVAERLFKLEPDNPGNYVLLCNIYTRHGMLGKADEVRRLMGINGVRKETGCSWIDVKNRTFVFTVNDRSHSRTEEIYEMLQKLKELIKKRGYVAETQFATNSVEGSEEQSLWCHSEKLALAFGLLVLPVGSPVRIKKNLRTCGDCHTVMKFASEIFQREIIVRDINRFHRFTNGLCSCRDYW
ncbi:pentatricopeptide repeat-containing protein At3g24000, mitochondrial-like [Abrus precatorius]|uniref:Pentatricopeptide repeat-containing protein At3g24000, mitochondrial-like n=1 Tax=Abrus precatorius TaxID=3816 RepID=A0A8B8L1Q1_ABRPR|nr:pentatricopeptide repeat-containing protein At3g24000, mitochondrial-like [Abrus precatorius]